MYVLLASAQAAGRNKKAFQIRRLAYGRKCCHMCEETHMYGNILGKEFGQFISIVMNLKYTVDNLHGKL